MTTMQNTYKPAKSEQLQGVEVTKSDGAKRRMNRKVSQTSQMRQPNRKVSQTSLIMIMSMNMIMILRK